MIGTKVQNKKCVKSTPGEGGKKAVKLPTFNQSYTQQPHVSFCLVVVVGLLDGGSGGVNGAVVLAV